MAKYDKDEKPGRLKQQQTIDLVQQVSKVCNDLGIKEPGAFLAQIMAGVDPRPGGSTLWYRMLELGRDEPPSEEDWKELFDLVAMTPAYRNGAVTVEAAQKAAEKLMDYLYPKLRSIDMQARLLMAVAPSPLKKKEMKLFNKWFNDEF
jgi:hypothetical protein